MTIANINANGKKYSNNVSMGGKCNCGTCNCNCGSQIMLNNLNTEIKNIIK